ncbi:MAG: BrnA antitoxin family protein [Erysipelotrichaceae bacterium]|nr:BrnA antitoxin family protein [Erysipelotrichaceae bacterium]
MKDEITMQKEYDFSKGIKNPYTKKTKAQITINLNVETIDYFKNMAAETGVPYQTIINLYLTDCARNQRKISFE